MTKKTNHRPFAPLYDVLPEILNLGHGEISQSAHYEKSTQARDRIQPAVSADVQAVIAQRNDENATYSAFKTVY